MRTNPAPVSRSPLNKMGSRSAIGMSTKPHRQHTNQCPTPEVHSGMQFSALDRTRFPQKLTLVSEPKTSTTRKPLQNVTNFTFPRPETTSFLNPQLDSPTPPQSISCNQAQAQVQAHLPPSVKLIPQTQPTWPKDPIILEIPYPKPTPHQSCGLDLSRTNPTTPCPLDISRQLSILPCNPCTLLRTKRRVSDNVGGSKKSKLFWNDDVHDSFARLGLNNSNQWNSFRSPHWGICREILSKKLSWQKLVFRLFGADLFM